MPRMVLLCGSLFVLSITTSLAMADENEKLLRTINVSGLGKATSPPDMATIYTGVITQSPTAGEALAANNQAMDNLQRVLEEHQIAAKDIQTSNFNVQPDYERGPRGQTKPKIVSYRVTNQVQVRVRNLPGLGKVLDALVKAGSNQMSGIRFGIDDPTGVLNQARNRAISDARARAELYAQAAGVRVGKVITISEQTAHVPQPRMMGRAMEMAPASSVPVAAGEQELQAAIQMTFSLEDD